MPGLNGTGPEGKGSMTGRGMGKCKGSQEESSKSNKSFGFGKRRRCGNRHKVRCGMNNGYRGGWD